MLFLSVWSYPKYAFFCVQILAVISDLSSDLLFYNLCVGLLVHLGQWTVQFLSIQLHILLWGVGGWLPRSDFSQVLLGYWFYRYPGTFILNKCITSTDSFFFFGFKGIYLNLYGVEKKMVVTGLVIPCNRIVDFYNTQSSEKLIICAAFSTILWSL